MSLLKLVASRPLFQKRHIPNYIWKEPRSILSLSYLCAVLRCASRWASVAVPELNQEASSCESMEQHTACKLSKKHKSPNKSLFKKEIMDSNLCICNAAYLQWALYCITLPLIIAVCIRFHKYDSVYLLAWVLLYIFQISDVRSSNGLGETW